MYFGGVTQNTDGQNHFRAYSYNLLGEPLTESNANSYPVSIYAPINRLTAIIQYG